ncbi:MAG: M23 family metallopeptidase [Bacteroidales bacterium]|nr:M23 family metallopeptidase [Bacteroidales bacterium]
MRKSVGISILVVAAVLLAAVLSGRVWVHTSQRRMAAQRDTLAVRLDSCVEAVSLLCGMDSLYRVRMHRDTAERFRMVRQAHQPEGDTLGSANLGMTEGANLGMTGGANLGMPEGANLGMTEGADSLAMAVQELRETVMALSGWMRETNELSVIAKERARFTPSICPLKEGTFRFTAAFGVRKDPMEGDGRMHEGIDLACPQGNPVHVTADGVVEFIDSDIFGYGNCIIVDHGYGYKTRYAHLSIIRTSENIRLKRGDVIGETGVSGRATGPHLHYEVILDGQTVDPEDYIDIKLQ